MNGLKLSIAAREVPNVRKTKTVDRATWLRWRAHTVGASEAPALFGVHPHRTPFELYGVKTGAYQPEFAEAIIDGDSITLPPAEVGLWLEAPALQLVPRVKPNWSIEPNPVPGGYHFVHEEHRISSTPDAFVYSTDEDGPGALQIKTVGEPIFRKDWISDGVFEPPMWVLIQTMLDAALSGCSWACIGVLVRGAFTASFRLYRVTLNPKVIARAFALVDQFWQRVEAGEPYDPDYGRDGAAIAALYSRGDQPAIELIGERAERMAELLAQREAEKAIEKAGSEAEKRRKALDSEIIFALGNAEAGSLPDGRMVSAKLTQRGAYQVQPTSFRTVRIVDPAASAKRVSGRKAAAPALAAGALPDSF